MGAGLCNVSRMTRQEILWSLYDITYRLMPVAGQRRKYNSDRLTQDSYSDTAIVYRLFVHSRIFHIVVM